MYPDAALAVSRRGCDSALRRPGGGQRGARLGLCLCLAWAVPAFAQAAPIVITKDRDLHFGRCEEVPGTRYVVDAAENPGPAACPGAYSARFSVTGDANAKVKITSDKNVTVTNGIESINVKLDQAPTGGNIRIGADGTLTIYMGGDYRVPPGGVSDPADLTGTSVLSVVYK